MELEKEDVLQVKAYLEKGIESLENGDPANLGQAIDMLSYDENDLAFRIWRYADEEDLDNHPRDFGYRVPEELIRSLKDINGSAPNDNYVRELESLSDYALKEVRENLEE